MSLYHHFQTAVTFTNFIPFIRIPAYILERSYKALVKKDLMGSILFKRVFKVLKHFLYISKLYILFLTNATLYLPNFALYNSEDNKCYPRCVC